MAGKLCKEQQISFSNNMEYSDFIADIKIFCEISAYVDPTLYCSQKIASSKEFYWYLWLNFLVLAFIDMINMSGKFQRNDSSRSPWLESLSKFSCEIVLEFQISKLLWGRTSNQNLAELPPVLIFLVIISAKMLESSIWALIQGSLQSQYLFLELEATYRRKSRWRCIEIHQNVCCRSFSQNRAKGYLKNVKEQVIRLQSKVWSNLQCF